MDKRFEVTGIAKKVGPDIHNKPSNELSDSIDGQTYALVIFPTNEHYSKVKVGDRVVVRTNYLVMSNHYGTSLHRELELWVEAGVTPIDALAAATSKVAEVFGIDGFGTIEEGKRAVLILIEGRTEKEITDTTKIKQIWIDGKPILRGRI